MSRPSIERLRELLRLDPETGHLYRRAALNNRAKVGDRADKLRTDGYLGVHVDNHRILAHHVVWALDKGYWPPSEIDHDNRTRSDNRPSNLLCEGRVGNNRNRPKIGKSQYIGVRKANNCDRYVARILLNSKRKCLGRFDTPEDAARAYDAAVLQHRGARFPTNASLGLLP